MLGFGKQSRETPEMPQALTFPQLKAALPAEFQDEYDTLFEKMQMKEELAPAEHARYEELNSLALQNLEKKD